MSRAAWPRISPAPTSHVPSNWRATAWRSETARPGAVCWNACSDLAHSRGVIRPGEAIVHGCRDVAVALIEPTTGDAQFSTSVMACLRQLRIAVLRWASAVKQGSPYNSDSAGDSTCRNQASVVWPWHCRYCLVSPQPLAATSSWVIGRQKEQLWLSLARSFY